MVSVRLINIFQENQIHFNSVAHHHHQILSLTFPPENENYRLSYLHIWILLENSELITISVAFGICLPKILCN